MKSNVWWNVASVAIASGSVMITDPAIAQSLFIAYPADQYETTYDRIFLIGTASPDGEVKVNGETIERSPDGHFAPTVPLQMGRNQITLTHGNEQLTLTVNRISATSPTPVGVSFAADSLSPAVNIARQPGELICFSAIAPPSGEVSVQLGNQTLPLTEQPLVELPPNSAVLTFQNQPIPIPGAASYQGCATATEAGSFGQPEFQLTLNGQTVSQAAPGTVSVLSPAQIEIAEVTAESGTARTGPSTDYSRLTPLPQGTQAMITGREGEWLRLDYGAWIRDSEVQIRSSAVPPRSLIRSVQARQVEGWTEIVFPLQVPVPVTVDQGSNTFTLTLHNATAQTDTILLSDDPLIERLDWTQPDPDRIQYVFHLKTEQQWGYKLDYRGTSLVLSLRHPPASDVPEASDRPLSGVSVLLDPGHGSNADLGARGPTGYPEKDVTLIVSKLLQNELTRRGATVYMTREGDEDLYPQDRVDMINEVEPTVSLSLHYNALPDNGDAIHTTGIGTFWYNTQAHDLAMFLHNYLVGTLDRPSYGVFWNNLALTRPTVAPAVLLELGFMINPYEFEWITNPAEQQKLAIALADGLTDWIQKRE
ncbi:MAG: N-acetylmuramoyl-L-alanine amidase [Synechococcales cyanobacterium T60_A2020_003]|nr:N-acetylmuramoyl-L-alanine amidase [Synechococcales cyanobacterium T60_A2020_003]